MWTHPATRRNLSALRDDGMVFVGPNDGAMACGEQGPGRMADPEEIFDAVVATLGGAERPVEFLAVKLLAGKKVMVTAGPTHEPIDPVRFIANRSSGKQGYAIARAARDAGAAVTLISGPVALEAPAGVALVRVETAREMAAAAEAALPCDIFIAAAAVADWRVERDAGQKIKKSGDAPPALNLVENPDILAGVARRPTERPPLVVGFAAETEYLIAHARKKLERKGCDLIVANDVSKAAGVMGGDENTLVLVSAEGETTWPRLGKEEAARRLVGHLAQILAQREEF
jgi:phosphopantothenoylcysteine decarboxylase/phosphopantothenate--cysteine ligase